MPPDRHDTHQTWTIRSTAGEFQITMGNTGGEEKSAPRVSWSLVLSALGTRRHSLHTRALIREMYEALTGCRLDLQLQRRDAPEQEQLLMERRLAEAFQNGALVALRSSPGRQGDAPAQRTGDSSSSGQPAQDAGSDERNPQQSRPENSGSSPLPSDRGVQRRPPIGGAARGGEKIFVTQVQLMGPSQFKHDKNIACCGWVEFKVTGYTRPVSDDDKKQIKWLVRLEGSEGRNTKKVVDIPMRGGTDTLLIEPISKDWEGKTIHAYAYFHSPSDDARASARVSTSGVFQAPGDSALTIGRFIQLVRKVEANHPELSADEVLGTLRNLYSQMLVKYKNPNTDEQAFGEQDYDDFKWRSMLGVLDRPEALILKPKGSLTEQDIKELRTMVPHAVDTEHPFVKYDRETGAYGKFVEEYGVVRDAMGEAVAVGHVVTGLAAGLRRNRAFRFGDDIRKYVPPVLTTPSGPVVVPPGFYKTFPRLALPPVGELVDTVYAATIAGDLGQSAVDGYDAVEDFKEKRGGNPPPAVARFSPPPAYSQEELDQEIERQADLCIGDWSKSESTSAELVGDIDGYLMGDALSFNRYEQEQMCKPGGRRLSEILHEYYCATPGVGEYDSTDRFLQFNKNDKDELRKEVTAFAATYPYKKGLTKGITNGAEYSVLIDKVLVRFWKWFDAKLAKEKKRRPSST